jgi:hypothetical protein
MPNTKRLLCGFHARIAWAKNLKDKVATEENRRLVALALDRLIRFNDLPPPFNTDELHMTVAAKEQLEDFYQLLRGMGKDGETFLSYFKTDWEPKTGYF